jgi:hypothetical protein
MDRENVYRCVLIWDCGDQGLYSSPSDFSKVTALKNKFKKEKRGLHCQLPYNSPLPPPPRCLIAKKSLIILM